MSDELTRDAIDIKDILDGPIGEVIERLKGLQKEYPDGEVEITSEMEYGETYERAYLNFKRPKTAGEIEYERLRGLEREYRQCCNDIQTMRRFEKADEVKALEDRAEALQEQLGKLATESMAMLVMMDGWPAVTYMPRPDPNNMSFASLMHRVEYMPGKPD